MAYNTLGLRVLANLGPRTMWELKTVDAVGDADETGYITDASTSATGAPGKGMQLGDIVWVLVVNSVTATTTVSDAGWYYVSAINATTGVGTITACGAA
jgi:hypothetical protein